MKNGIVLTTSCLIALSGCASVIEGKSQDIEIVTTPPGAECVLTRNNVRLGAVAPTPGTLHITKTKDDLTIDCNKPGYKAASTLVESGYPENNWLYILVGGPIGWGYDSATGSDNEYASPVTLNLLK
jgi:hypothetical protein